MIHAGKGAFPAGPPYPKAVRTGSFDESFDLRSFGEPIKRLRAVAIHDTDEPLVDMRDLEHCVALRPGCLPLLRRTVARMVADAGRALPAGHRLFVTTCLRTPAMQSAIRDRITEEQRAKHPEWTPATLTRMLNRMVAPLDPRAPAPHTTGAAVDVSIEGPDGALLTFSPTDDWWLHAPTYARGLDQVSRDNRALLIAAMEGAGLTNYLGEWWHWSFGDQGWALRVDSTIAYYGAVDVADSDALRVPEP
ncbi:MAG: M15 family metallopeptidase [Capsulimonadaceae bacterium]